MTEKQAILRDLKVIAILDKKIDYSDHDNIGAVLKLNPKSLFSTEYGQRYLDRIRLMYDGKEYEHTCILCGSPFKDANPVCEDCYKMITLGNADVPEKPKQIVSEEDTTEAPKPVAHDTPEPDAQNADTVTAEAAPESADTASEAVAPESVDTASEAVAPESVDTASEEAAPESVDSASPEEMEMDSEEKAQDEMYSNHDSEGPSGRDRYIDIWRALIILFVVMCFSIAIVCGLIIAIRDLRVKNRNGEVSERVLKDADLRDYYNTIYTETAYTIKTEEDS